MVVLTVVINYRREIIATLILDFEIGKVGLSHIIGEFSIMMELVKSCIELISLLKKIKEQNGNLFLLFCSFAFCFLLELPYLHSQ